jgi:hypothetical protein
VREILESHRPEPLPDDVQAAVRSIVRRADTRYRIEKKEKP